ncbi:hypothetical protein K474DRAFT_1676953 [Panus rudis PR-1116 ss-1]|nr:hypothetical protein K474DRAFT_1676953 [Panus rudis PR-1116 ss-1]
MYALKTPSFLRPSSRPSSPSPSPDMGAPTTTERPTRSSMLSFSTFKRTASPPAKPATPVVQDGSYMEVLNLKLSEAVSKALVHPSGTAPAHELLNGKLPLPPGRGRALGDLIAAEIKASSDNAYLRRAIIRTLHRPLSVLVTNISSSLLPLLSSSSFLNPSAPTPSQPTNNTTQLHALGLATFAGELVDVFDELGLGVEDEGRADGSGVGRQFGRGDAVGGQGGQSGRGDGLQGVKRSLRSIVERVLEPLLNAIKNELIVHIDALESPTSAVVFPNLGTKTGANTKSSGSTNNHYNNNTNYLNSHSNSHSHSNNPNNNQNGTTVIHPTIIHLQHILPLYVRTLTRYATTRTSEVYLTRFVLAVIWRALVALANRPSVGGTSISRVPSSPSLSPVGGIGGISGGNGVGNGQGAGGQGGVGKTAGKLKTPPTTPPPSRFTLKLPSSRPPSPTFSAGSGSSDGSSSNHPSSSPLSSSPLSSFSSNSSSHPHNPTQPTPHTDAFALYTLLHTLLPRPSPQNLNAVEAVEDAFGALWGLVGLLGFVGGRGRGGGVGNAHFNPRPNGNNNSNTSCTSFNDSERRGGEKPSLEEELAHVTRDVPSLIALPVVLRAFVWPFLGLGGCLVNGGLGGNNNLNGGVNNFNALNGNVNGHGNGNGNVGGNGNVNGNHGANLGAGAGGNQQGVGEKRFEQATTSLGASALHLSVPPAASGVSGVSNASTLTLNSNSNATLNGSSDTLNGSSTTLNGSSTTLNSNSKTSTPTLSPSSSLSTLSSSVNYTQQQPTQKERPISSLLGLSEHIYRAQCIPGFSRAEACTVAVCGRVLEVLGREVGRVERGVAALGVGASNSAASNFSALGAGNSASNATNASAYTSATLIEYETKLNEAKAALRWLERELAIVVAEQSEQEEEEEEEEEEELARTRSQFRCQGPAQAQVRAQVQSQGVAQVQNQTQAQNQTQNQARNQSQCRGGGREGMKYGYPANGGGSAGAGYGNGGGYGNVGMGVGAGVRGSSYYGVDTDIDLDIDMAIDGLESILGFTADLTREVELVVVVSDVYACDAYCQG